MPAPFSVARLVKTGNGEPLKARTQPGGWAYVFKEAEWLGLKEPISRDILEREEQERLEESQKLDAETRRKRLLNAPKLPEQRPVVSVAYTRNQDVVAEVLERANGICERCGQDAPFLRASNGKPYLEGHHWVPLSEGGEDTVDNAAALCPNCHRELHYGQRENS